MAIQEWSNEKLQAMVAEADKYWEEHRFSKKAAGLLAFAHLMKPQECAVALRLAATIAVTQRRDDEAVRLAKYGLSHCEAPSRLESPALLSYLKILSQCFLRIKDHRTALRLAMITKSDDEIKLARRLQSYARRSFIGHFPASPIAECLRLLFNCTLAKESLGGYPNVNELRSDQPMFAEDAHPTIYWIRDETDLNDLTPDRLANLMSVQSFVCSSMYLRNVTLARLPFLEENRVHVILEAPLQTLPQTLSETEPVVIYRGDPSGFGPVKEAFAKDNKKWLVTSDAADVYHPNPAIFILLTERPTPEDMHNLIVAQCNGAIPICTAVRAIPEYMVGGFLIKPRIELNPIFDHEHRKAICDAAVREGSAHLSVHQHIAKEAYAHFGAENGAIRWLEFINREADRMPRYREERKT